MPDLGPSLWTQPLFGGDGVPQMVVNGEAVEFPLRSYDASLVDAQGVVVETAGGQQVPHQLLEAAAAPLSLGRFEIEVELDMVSEDIRRIVTRCAALARAASLSVWFDRPGGDWWEGDASRTTFTLTRSTGYGSTGVTWAQRPARCWVAGTEQTMVTGTPSAGQCKLSQTTDATQIVLGTAPAAGAVVELLYYPVVTGAEVDFDESREDNGGIMSLTVVESIPVRSYG